MISLVLPYWCRREATMRSLDLLEQCYRSGPELEVIIVDDGSPESESLTGLRFYDIPVWVIRLPTKDQPKNPCVPINAGVRAARGEIIALSNPEILHETPVLGAMRDELETLGEKGYVLAACWCPEEDLWHCHSSVSVHRPDGARVVPGTGYHFLSMLRRTFFYSAGGFDEDYREGTGWDDPDWVNRLVRAGARFRIRDDLVVKHPRRGAQSHWIEDRDKNRALYDEKWPSLPVMQC